MSWFMYIALKLSAFFACCATKCHFFA